MFAQFFFGFSLCDELMKHSNTDNIRLKMLTKKAILDGKNLNEHFFA